MMAFPSERQKKAAVVARELQALGATVTNVLPLADGQPLRFWVSDYKKREILTALADAGYEAIFIGTGFQVCTATYSMGLVNNFEIPIAADRQPVPDDRTIYGEVVDRQKEAAQKAAVKAMTEAIYG